MCRACGQLTLNKKRKKQFKIKKSFSGIELSDDIRMMFGIDPKSMTFFKICLPYNVRQTYQRGKRRGVTTIKAARTLFMTQSFMV